SPRPLRSDVWRSSRPNRRAARTSGCASASSDSLPPYWMVLGEGEPTAQPHPSGRSPQSSEGGRNGRDGGPGGNDCPLPHTLRVRVSCWAETDAMGEMVALEGTTAPYPTPSG